MQNVFADFSRCHHWMDGYSLQSSKTEFHRLKKMLTHRWLSWRLQGRLNIYLEVTVFVFTEICCHRLLMLEGLLMLMVLYTSQSGLLASQESVSWSTDAAIFGGLSPDCGSCSSLVAVKCSVPRSLPFVRWAVGLLPPPRQPAEVLSKESVLWPSPLLCPAEVCFPLVLQWEGCLMSLQNYKNTYTVIYKCINI